MLAAAARGGGYVTKFDVFISYAREDEPTAKAACERLEAAGMRCWVAPRDIAPSDKWAAVIVAAIKDCRLMVLIFSSNANQSEHVNREVPLAFENKIPVVVFRIEDISPLGNLANYLTSVQWLDALTLPLEEHLNNLVARVAQRQPSGSAGEKRNSWALGRKLDEIVVETGLGLGYRPGNHIDASRYKVTSTVCQIVDDPARWSAHVNDQSVVVGWAGYDAKTGYLPPEHYLAHAFREGLIEACSRGLLAGQGPDGKLLVRMRDEGERW
jgi:hypothetical protein